MATTDSKPITDQDRNRFWCRVDTSGSGCWLWVGGKRANGYGMFAVKTREGRWTQTTSHRFAYRDRVGPIPDEFEIDHLCRNRACVNPQHLEAVTLQENRKRRNANKTHCPRGHAYTEANTRLQGDSDGYYTRVCRTCANTRQRINRRLREARTKA